MCTHLCYNVLQVPFGYSRKDVLLIGLGVTLGGVGLESGLEVLLLYSLTSVLAKFTMAMLVNELDKE